MRRAAPGAPRVRVARPSLPPRPRGPPRPPVGDGPGCLPLHGCRLGLWGSSRAGPPRRSRALQPGNSPPSRRGCCRAAAERGLPVPLRSELQGAGFSPGRVASSGTRQPSLDTPPDVRLSPHPALQRRRCHVTRLVPFLTEPQWHQGQSPRLCPLERQGQCRLSFSPSWPSFTMAKTFHPGIWLRRCRRPPSHTLAFSRPLPR